MNTPIRLTEKLATFTDPWSTRVLGAFNGHDLMVRRSTQTSLSGVTP